MTEGHPASLDGADEGQGAAAFAGPIHATCVVIGDQAVLIRGESGTGKSDLALRLIDRGAMLVSDDYTYVQRQGPDIKATPPPEIAGLIEVRGVGLISMPHRPSASVAMIVHLLNEYDADPDRLPLDRTTERLCGQDVPLMTLRALEPSAPIKVELALNAKNAAESSL